MTIYRHSVVPACAAATMAQTATGQINGTATNPFGAVACGGDLPPGIDLQVRNDSGREGLAGQRPVIRSETTKLGSSRSL